jgi:hypothetical protein
MNLYQKLAKVRVELQNLKLKKSGKNTYSKYTYYELGDFLPAVNSLCEKHELVTKFNIISDKSAEKAILTVINASEPEEKIEFVSPTAEVEIGKKRDGTGGAEPIQNLGGKITYMRRYMLMTAFEMVESDLVEKIKKEVSSEINEEDLKLIDEAETLKGLTEVYEELKKKYKLKVILPEFKRKKVDLQQEDDVNQVQEKKESKK